MEPVTHILTGACLGRAGCNRKAAYATAVMAVAAEFPDIDTLWGFLGGPVTGFQHHRGITHTFVGIPFEAALLVGCAWAVHRFRMRKGPAPNGKPLTKAPVRWGMLYVFALIALLSHLFLDFTNNYGLRPFFPFHPQWYAGSFVFIFDPVLFVLLLSAFILPLLFGLISSEVGARRPAFRGRGWAIAVLALIVCWWSARAYEHGRAVELAQEQSRAVDPGDPEHNVAARFAQPVRVLANPDPLSLFRWYTVSDFGNFYQLAEADTLAGHLSPAQDVLPKPAQTPAVLAAVGTPLGRAYLDWSPVPIVTVRAPGDPLRPATDDPEENAATLVIFEDPRFFIALPFLSSPEHPLTGYVLLDSHMRVLVQRMDGKDQPER